jgi:hypothetical protein
VTLLFLVGVVLVVLVAMSSGVSRSSAQTGAGYGAPQVLEDQTITPASHGGSHTGVFVGTGVALGILGGAAFYGLRRSGTGPFHHGSH